MANDQFLAYDEAGNGNPLVLIHGFCENKTLWQPYMATLGQQFRVIALDLPGFGGSADLLPATCTMESLAQQVEDLMEHLRIPQAVVVGHSLGGYVSLALAELYPERIKGLGLFHSTALADTPEKQKQRSHSIAFIQEKGIALFADIFVDNLFYMPRHKFFKEGLAATIAMVSQTPSNTATVLLQAMRERQDRLHVLRETNAPVQFIIGKQDASVPFDSYTEQIRLPKDCHIHILDETGHVGMVERSAETLHFVQQFATYCWQKV